MNAANDITPGNISPRSGQRVYVDREDGLYWMDGPALMYAGPFYTDGTLDWENAGDVDMEASDPDVITEPDELADCLRGGFAEVIAVGAEATA